MSEQTNPRICTHGMSGSPTYVSWMKMKSRCSNPNAINFDRYGGAGIAVCQRWERFEAFLEDMGERPSLGHSIDRIDGTKGYCKENCRWATEEEQSRNRECSIRLTSEGKTLSPAEWAKLMNVSVKTIYNRINLGWNDDDVVHGREPRSRMLTSGGVTKSMKDWAESSGLSPATICKRLSRGWSQENAVKNLVQ